MPENSSHAPGTNIGRDDGAIRQHQGMAQSGNVMSGGNFGVGPLPGTKIAQNHGAHVRHDGIVHRDADRANRPNMHMGKGNMAATAHSMHGPHHHKGG